jgi:hypothetical protein
MATHTQPLWPYENYTYVSTAITIANPVPQNILQNGFSYSVDSGVVRDNMDAGFPFVRRRFTGTVKSYSVAFSLTYDQFETFESFFFNAPSNDTVPGILQGSIQFYFPNPLWVAGAEETEADRPVILVRWIASTGSAPYKVLPDGNTSNLLVSFQIEELPS